MWRILAFSSHVFIVLTNLYWPTQKKQTKKKQRKTKKKTCQKIFLAHNLKGWRAAVSDLWQNLRMNINDNKMTKKVSCQFKSDSHTSHYNCRGTGNNSHDVRFKPFKEKISRNWKNSAYHTQLNNVYISCRSKCHVGAIKLRLFIHCHPLCSDDRSTVHATKFLKLHMQTRIYTALCPREQQLINWLI